jgi:hypothetical protein
MLSVTFAAVQISHREKTFESDSTMVFSVSWEARQGLGVFVS